MENITLSCHIKKVVSLSLMTVLLLSVVGGDIPSHKAYAQISDSATTSARLAARIYLSVV